MCWSIVAFAFFLFFVLVLFGAGEDLPQRVPCDGRQEIDRVFLRDNGRYTVLQRGDDNVLRCWTYGGRTMRGTQTVTVVADVPAGHRMYVTWQGTVAADNPADVFDRVVQIHVHDVYDIVGGPDDGRTAPSHVFPEPW